MKAMKLGLVVFGAALITFGLGGMSYAFHDGGVGECAGCHTMHNFDNNAVAQSHGHPGGGTPYNAANAALTIGTDASSTCLFCHAGAGSAGSYHIASTNGNAYTPGGDFFWLTKSYSITAHGSTTVYNGYDKGHSIVAADFPDYANSDPDLTTAPGATTPFSSSNLGCNSCHDPHGTAGGGTKEGLVPIGVSGSYGATPPAGTRAGNYRLLYDAATSNPQGTVFPAVPVAKADTTAKYMDNNAKHPAYGSGMSEWCASCHNQFLNDTGSTTSTHRHPTGNSAELGATFATNYQQYKSTGNYAAGNVGTSYLWLVPVEFGVTTQSGLTASPSTGVTATSNVLCLSCHRAHASAFPSATRWDMGETFIADTAVNTTNIPSMVDNTAPWQGENIATVFSAGEYQRSLCNKCHVQD